MKRAGRPPTTRADVGAHLGQVLRSRRAQAGMTRDALARQLGMSLNTLMAIEQGRVADPGFFTVVTLAAGLGIELDDLLASVGRKYSVIPWRCQTFALVRGDVATKIPQVDRILTRLGKSSVVEECS